jgi:4-oxalocrotonate tautomerase
MPVIHVEMWKGRTTEQKRELAAAFTREMQRICGTTPQAIQIIFSDVEKADWAMAGKLAIDSPPDDPAQKT